VSTLRIPYFTFSDCGYAEGENTDFSKPMSPNVPYFKQHCRRSWDSDIIHKALDPFSGAEGDGQRTFQLEVKTLRTIMAELGHTYVQETPLTSHSLLLAPCSSPLIAAASAASAAASAGMINYCRAPSLPS
jgi:hypothetical protein